MQTTALLLPRFSLFPFFAFLPIAALVCGCNAADFDPSSNIESVRILATAADKPYAKPGDAVNMQVLAFDGRPDKPRPMGVWWIPQACVNPASDAYYSCYSAFGQSFAPGVDLTPRLTAGPNFAFQMPGDAISAHGSSRGGEPYGLAVTFVIACAGHVEYTPPPSGSPANTLPFGCFDENHVQLGADDFVFAYSLVYAFADRTNANPVIDHLTVSGMPVEEATGIVLDHCTTSDIDDCPTVPLDTVISPSNQELDPADLDANGNVLREEIWVDYYLTAGKVKHDTLILFDPSQGQLTGLADDLHAPQTAGSYLLWAVAHDNRGGVSWVQVGLAARN